MNITGQGHSLTFATDHSYFKIKTYFSQKQLGHLKPNLVRKLMGVRKMKIYANEFGDIFKMAAMPIYGKNV